MWLSSPCTDFSIAGSQEGLDGSQSSAILSVPKLLFALGLAGTKPPVAVVENVTGFLKSGGGADFPHVIQAMVERGYRPGALIVDAALWTPMTRTRVFLVFLRAGVEPPEGCVAAGPPAQWCTDPLLRAVGRLSPSARSAWTWWTMPPPPPRTLTLGGILDDVPAERWFGPAASTRLLDLLTPGGLSKAQAIMRSGRLQHGVSVEKSHPEKAAGGWHYDGRRYGRQRIATFRDSEVFTLLASATGSSRQRLVEILGDQVRLRDFTPNELGQLMGVPKTFVLPRTVGLAMKALGDGVAVPVVRHLAANLIEPLARAAREQSPPPRKTGSWRRPRKSATTGQVTQFEPRDYIAVKLACADEGVSMQHFMEWPRTTG